MDIYLCWGIIYICAAISAGGIVDGNDNGKHLKFCKVYNCIYRLRCKVCNMSYIEQTSTPLNIRINNHKTDIRKPKCGKCEQEIEFTHFEKHGNFNIEILILKIVPNKNERLICDINLCNGLPVWINCKILSK